MELTERISNKLAAFRCHVILTKAEGFKSFFTDYIKKKLKRVRNFLVIDLNKHFAKIC